jgi:hypothetical protein
VNKVFFFPLVYVPPHGLYNTLELWIAGDARSLLANDTILGHPTVTVSTVSTPSHGTLLMAADGSFSYRPDAGFVGTDRFTYSFSGGGLTSNVATVTIHVTASDVAPANHPPVLSGVPAGTQNVSLGKSITFQAAATDPDAADTLTFSLQGSVPAGATINAQGAFAWTPLATQLGPSTFTVRVTDNGTPNLSDDESISISVNDTTPPILSMPANLTTDAVGPSGAAVTYFVVATDAVDGAVTVSCSPASGSMFAIGTTVVDCSAIDAHANRATGNFSVTVKGAATQVSDLTSLTTNFALAPGFTNSLVSKLQAALDSISNGKPSACGQFTSLIQAVNAQSGKGITPAQAAQLIASATQIKAVIGCR